MKKAKDTEQHKTSVFPRVVLSLGVAGIVIAASLLIVSLIKPETVEVISTEVASTTESVDSETLSYADSLYCEAIARSLSDSAQIWSIVNVPISPDRWMTTFTLGRHDLTVIEDGGTTVMLKYGGVRAQLNQRWFRELRKIALGVREKWLQREREELDERERKKEEWRQSVLLQGAKAIGGSE